MKTAGKPGLYLAALALIGLTATPAMAQVRSARTAPAEGGDTVQCSRVAIHLTQLGLAFECANPANTKTYLFVVEERSFSGRVPLTIDLLNQAAASPIGSGRGNVRRLTVRHRPPSGQAAAICNLANGATGNLECRDAVDVAF